MLAATRCWYLAVCSLYVKAAGAAYAASRMLLCIGDQNKLVCKQLVTGGSDIQVMLQAPGPQRNARAEEARFWTSFR